MKLNKKKENISSVIAFCAIVSVFCIAVWLRIRFCRFVVAVARSKGQATARHSKSIHYLFQYNLMWWWWWCCCCRSASSLFFFPSFFYSFHSISFDFRWSCSVNRTTSVHKVLIISHSHTIMRATRSVHFFCRTRFFFLRLLVSSSICSPIILHRSKLIPLWLL